jgi:hypothetical protein
MSNGTTVEIYAARIHKSNARCVKEDAEGMLQYYRDRLMILGACAPHQIIEDGENLPWEFYIRREISDIIAEMREEWFKELVACNIIDFPDDCKDELEMDILDGRGD